MCPSILSFSLLSLASYLLPSIYFSVSPINSIFLFISSPFYLSFAYRIYDPPLHFFVPFLPTLECTPRRRAQFLAPRHPSTRSIDLSQTRRRRAALIRSHDRRGHERRKARFTPGRRQPPTRSTRSLNPPATARLRGVDIVAMNTGPGEMKSFRPTRADRKLLFRRAKKRQPSRWNV